VPSGAYIIQADVIDITSDAPQNGDIFFVDTNVWYWLTYSNASFTAKPYQLNGYPNYISSTLANGATLCYSDLLLPELAHIIENNECGIFNRLNSTNFKSKDLRRNHPSERIAIASKVRLAWEQIQRDAQPLELVLDISISDRALDRFATEMVDGYDLFILEIMANEGITKVITDDSDYATVAGIQVFTVNLKVLADARTQNKLVIR